MSQLDRKKKKKMNKKQQLIKTGSCFDNNLFVIQLITSNHVTNICVTWLHNQMQHNDITKRSIIFLFSQVMIISREWYFMFDKWLLSFTQRQLFNFLELYTFLNWDYSHKSCKQQSCCFPDKFGQFSDLVHFYRYYHLDLLAIAEQLSRPNVLNLHMKKEDWNKVALSIQVNRSRLSSCTSSYDHYYIGVFILIYSKKNETLLRDLDVWAGCRYARLQSIRIVSNQLNPQKR